MSDRGCLHCTLLAAIVGHFPDGRVEATEAVEALGPVAGQIIAAVDDPQDYAALLRLLGAVTAGTSVANRTSAPAARH